MDIKKLIIFLIIATNLIVTALVFCFIYKGSCSLTYNEKSLVFSILSGALGSTVYMARGFYQSAVERQDSLKMFDFDRFIWWYLFRPILGAIVGGLAFLIIFLAFDFAYTAKNQCAFVLFGFLAGYNFHDFVEKRISKKTEVC